MKRGEVWWINFDPSVGGEIRKTRPAAILSNDISKQIFESRAGRAFNEQHRKALSKRSVRYGQRQAKQSYGRPGDYS